MRRTGRVVFIALGLVFMTCLALLLSVMAAFNYFTTREAFKCPHC